MRDLNQKLRGKVVKRELLLKYGFTDLDGTLIYKQNLTAQFLLWVSFSEKEFTSKIIDLDFNEEYVLADLEDACGEFVGSIRKLYDEKLEEIISSCAISQVYKEDNTLKLIEYIKSTYGRNLEFLWEDENAICRHQKNNKWFIVFMKVKGASLGFKEERFFEVINLKHPSDKIPSIVNGENILRAYHMNKSHWITVLPQKTEFSELIALLNTSFDLTK